jgi:hypothetical protein
MAIPEEMRAFQIWKNSGKVSFQIASIHLFKMPILPSDLSSIWKKSGSVRQSAWPVMTLLASPSQGMHCHDKRFSCPHVAHRQ